MRGGVSRSVEVTREQIALDEDSSLGYLSPQAYERQRTEQRSAA